MTPLIHQARLHRNGQYFRPNFLEDKLKRKTSPNDKDRTEKDTAKCIRSHHRRETAKMNNRSSIEPRKLYILKTRKLLLMSNYITM